MTRKTLENLIELGDHIMAEMKAEDWARTEELIDRRQQEITREFAKQCPPQLADSAREVLSHLQRQDQRIQQLAASLRKSARDELSSIRKRNSSAKAYTSFKKS